MQTSPVPMSSVGEHWVLDASPESPYAVAIAPGDNLAICFGQDARRPGARFEHEHVVLRRRRLHEFKHSRANGSKFWTARPGVDLWFIIPKAAIMLVPEKGHSYVPAVIGGVKVTFNVSGGSCGCGWQDSVGRFVSASVGHPISDLRRIAAVAVRDAALEAELLAYLESVDTMDERDVGLYRQMVFAKPVSEALAKRFRAGARALKIVPVAGLRVEAAGRLDGIDFVRRLTLRAPTPEELRARPTVTRIGVRGDSDRVRHFRVVFPCGLYQVRPAQVDWVRTAEANDIPLPPIP